MNFNSQKHWTHAYRSLFAGIGMHRSDNGSQISLDMFAYGFFALAFDLTPDRSGNEDHLSIANRGNVRIDIEFEKELPNTITCIVYTEYDASIAIDKSRNIITNFS